MDEHVCCIRFSGKVSTSSQRRSCSGSPRRGTPVLVLGNVGLELATSTPLWFRGTYLFGWALRPVTVEVWVFSAQDGKQVWHESAERIVAREALKARPRSERSKKKVQLEASLRAAVEALARVLSEGGHLEWWWPRGEAVWSPREPIGAIEAP